MVCELAGYIDFSDNISDRRVHEPLEEFCVQSVLRKVRRNAPRTIKPSAYWSHYSMWLMKAFLHDSCVMVEPDGKNIECGRNTLSIDGYSGEFVQAFVGATGFHLDQFSKEPGISDLASCTSTIRATSWRCSRVRTVPG